MPWNAVLITYVVTQGLAALTVYLLLEGRTTRRWIAERLVKPEPPRLYARHSLRHVVLSNRARALEAGDLPAAARAAGLLAQEARLRAFASHEAWLAHRNEATKLYPQNLGGWEWNYRNAAADFFCHHFHAGLLLNPRALPSLNETLRAEGALRTGNGLCTPADSRTGKPIGVDHEELMFGSSEYAKDGLISLYERHGRGLIGDKVVAVVDAVIAGSSHASKYGKLPGSGAEVNGNMLQLCGRLSYAEGRRDYAEFSARVADAMVRESMAANGGLPPKFYDYESGRVVESVLKLKDHGNEAVLGLAETYAMAVDRKAEPAWAERAGAWAEPLAKMFELMLTHGLTADGLLAETMKPSPPRVTSQDVSDNWGYILAGAMLYCDAARRDGRLSADRITAIEAAVEKVARASFARPPGMPWGGTMDDEADVIESAVYIAAHRPALRDEAFAWIDRHVVALYDRQHSDGFASYNYLDGNFIRTCLLYADVHSGGWRVDPWRPDVVVGFARCAGGNAALTVLCSESYSGNLIPPEPRHRTHMKLPWNWPRLNSWPEWFVPHDGVRVTGATGVEVPRGPAPTSAIPLSLPASGSATINFSTTTP